MNPASSNVNWEEEKTAEAWFSTEEIIVWSIRTKLQMQGKSRDLAISPMKNSTNPKESVGVLGTLRPWIVSELRASDLDHAFALDVHSESCGCMVNPCLPEGA